AGFLRSDDPIFESFTHEGCVRRTTPSWPDQQRRMCHPPLRVSGDLPDQVPRASSETRGRFDTGRTMSNGKRSPTTASTLSAIVLLGVVAACATTSSAAPAPDLLAFLEHGPVLRTDVTRLLGTPSAIFEADHVLTYRLRASKTGYSLVP